MFVKSAEPSTVEAKGEPAEAATGLTPSDPTILEVEDLDVRFELRDRTVHAVRGLSYSIRQGQTLAIIGESGSGKTVSSRAIMGLLPPTAQVAGSVRLQGKELLGLPERDLRRHRGPDLAMVFQDPARSLNPTMRVGQQISEAIRRHLPTTKDEAHERTVELLQMVRLPSARQRYSEYPHELSGGMRQRVMIAMALACAPKVLFADEATTALDVTTQAQIMDLLQDLQKELHMALVLISHDMGLAASFTDEVLVMYGGKSVEQAPTKVLFSRVRMPYTRVLLDAIPRVERPSHSLMPVVQGRPPDMTRPIPGCSFAPRCPRAAPRCSTEEPPFTEHEENHRYACFFPMGEEEPDGVRS